MTQDLAGPGVETRMFVCTNVVSNNNKFWEVSIDASETVRSKNGRVGTKGDSRVLGHGRVLMERKIREKTRDGYREVAIVGAPVQAGTASAAQIVSAAEEEIGRGNPVVTDLVRQLARINRHQILAASGGQMDLDLTTGVISTPVGVVTAANVHQARDLLQTVEPFVQRSDFDNRTFMTTLEAYLMLVPQKVGAKRGWHREFITSVETLTQQGALLDQLEASIDIAKSRVLTAQASDATPRAPIFDVTMTVSEDDALRRRVAAFHEAGRKSFHASHRLKMGRIFDVSLGTMARDYQGDGLKVGGIQELWHGTRAHNLLSILKSGLIIAPQNGSIAVNGRMFGNGIYFSDQSTKSLNYAHGYWDGGKQDDRCFMFLADVAMGRPWNPDRTGSSLKPPKGYDSVFARGGVDRVQNNEMIVYRTAQVNLKYLVEFQA